MKLKSNTNQIFNEMFNKSAHKVELLEHPTFKYFLDQAIQRRKENTQKPSSKPD